MILDRIPIRVRLTLGHALWMSLIFTAIGVGVYRVVEDNVMQSLDSTLLTSARSVRDDKISDQRLYLQGPQYWKYLFEDYFSQPQNSVKAYAQLIDTSGAVQAKTRNFRVRLPVSRVALKRAEQGQETFETFKLQSGKSLRQLTLPIIIHGRFVGKLVQVGTPLTDAQSTLKSVKRMLWLTLSIGLGISVVFGYLLTRRSLRPVTQVTSAVATLGVDNNFDNRLKLPPAKDEMRCLISRFNEMIDRLEDAFVRLKRFSGDVSHELRTPIAVIRGEAELALRRIRTPEEYQTTLATIVKESENMSGIVEDLLLLARAQGQSIELDLEELSLKTFVEGVLDSVKSEISKKGISLELVNEGQETIKLSRGYFALALKNLLLNAAKHSPENAHIKLLVTSTYNETRFDVIDYGEGIPEKDLPYIFDTFYRVESARNRSTGGAGIGLSLSRALVSLHGGKISVKSVFGQGSTFRATLPHQGNPMPSISSRRKKSVDLIAAKEVPVV